MTEREVVTEELDISFGLQGELDHSMSESIGVSIFQSLRCQENLIRVENHDEVAETPHVCKSALIRVHHMYSDSFHIGSKGSTHICCQWHRHTIG